MTNGEKLRVTYLPGPQWRLTKVAARLGDVRAEKSPIGGRIDNELLFHRVLKLEGNQDSATGSYGIHVHSRFGRLPVAVGVCL